MVDSNNNVSPATYSITQINFGNGPNALDIEDEDLSPSNDDNDFDSFYDNNSNWHKKRKPRHPGPFEPFLKIIMLLLKIMQKMLEGCGFGLDRNNKNNKFGKDAKEGASYPMEGVKRW